MNKLIILLAVLMPACLNRQIPEDATHVTDCLMPVRGGVVQDPDRLDSTERITVEELAQFYKISPAALCEYLSRWELILHPEADAENSFFVGETRVYGATNTLFASIHLARDESWTEQSTYVHELLHVTEYFTLRADGQEDRYCSGEEIQELKTVNSMDCAQAEYHCSWARRGLWKLEWNTTTKTHRREP